MASTLAPPDPPLADGVVLLRPWADTDVDGMVAACQDPDIHRFIPIPWPYGPADAADYLARTRRGWDEGTAAGFAVVDATAPDRLLGAVNVAVGGGVGMAGYWVAPAARRAGVATRALRLLTHWAFASLGLRVVLLEIRDENLASVMVAERCGYHRAGRVEVERDAGVEDAALYVRLAPG